MEVRHENVLFFKYLGDLLYHTRSSLFNLLSHLAAKIFGDNGLDQILEVIDPLLFDIDKYKQRAGAEILCGIMRGA